MITTSNATWNAQLPLLVKQPLWALYLPGLLGGLWITSFDPAAEGVAVPGGATWKKTLQIPSGAGQTVDELSGQSSISQFQVKSIDPDGTLKSLLPPSALPSALGQIAYEKLGFPSMNLADFVTVSTGRCTKIGWTPDALVSFSIDDLQRSTVQYIFLEGGPAPWLPGDPTPVPPVGRSWQSNGQLVQDSNPFYLQGNPMELVLAVYQNFLGIGQASTDPSTWQLYLEGDDSTLINPNTYIDVPGILLLRDHQFNGEWMEFVVKAQTTAKDWLESQIFKALGLYTVVLSTGQITLKSMKTPPSTSPVSWSGRSIMEKTAEFETLPIVNDIQARFNQDDSQGASAAPSYLSDVEYQDAASIAQFAQETVQQMEFSGMRTRRGAKPRAFLTADRIFRRHAHGTPVYKLGVQFRNLQPELGVDAVLLSHPVLPDLKNNGVLGLTDVPCEITERRPAYDRGTLDYSLLDTRFVGATKAYQIAPAGTPNWTGSTTLEKQTYLYICGDDGLMPDGTPGNTIF